jgi:RNA polymerase-associated protein LEO1
MKTRVIYRSFVLWYSRVFIIKKYMSHKSHTVTGIRWTLKRRAAHRQAAPFDSAEIEDRHNNNDIINKKAIVTMSDDEDKSVNVNDGDGEDKAKKNVSNRDLFGDSSDDDDDDDDDDMMVDATKKDTKSPNDADTAAAAKDTADDVLGDSEEEEEESEKPAAVSTKPPRRSIHDASSDDEDDVEFDDNGAVVGLSSSTVAGVKLASKSKSDNNKTEDDNDDMEDDFDDDDVTNKLAVTKHKPVHLTVPAVITPPPTDPNNDNKTELYFTRLPNMLGIQPEAFDLDTYSAAVEHNDYSVHDMVRWRYRREEATGQLMRTVTVDNTDGALQRESNTRLVEWEDGSWTLHIGKEAFEVDAVNSGGNDFAGLNGYLYLSQQATKKPMGEDGEDDDDDAVEEPAGTVLECMGPVVSRLVARPSLQSEAHKSLTVAIRQRTIKKARIAEYVTELDPEKSKQERIQVKEELEKAAARKRQGYSGGYGGGAGGGGGGRAAGGRSRRSYLEDDEDFDTTNIKAMKRGEYEEMDDYGEDSESEEEERTFHKARPTAAAARAKQKDESSSDGDDDVLMDDDDDDEIAPVAKTNKKRSSQAVIDDDDSDSD